MAIRSSPPSPRTELDGTPLILLYVVAVVVTPEFELLGIPKVRVSDLVLVPIAVYLLASQASTSILKPALPLLLPFSLLIIWDFFVLNGMGSPEQRLYGFYYLAKRIGFAVTLLVGMMLARSLEGRTRLIMLLLAATPVFSWMVLESVNLEAGSGEAMRASGPIAAQQCSTALFLVVLLLLTLGVLLATQSWGLRLLGLATLGLGIPALLATGTRGTLIDLAIGAAGLELLRRHLIRSLLCLLLLGIVLVTSWAFLPGGLRDRLAETVPQFTVALAHSEEAEQLAGGNSASARIASMKSAFHYLIAVRPLAGWGTAYRPLGFADNFYVTEWTYHGLVGLGLALWLLTRLGVLLVRAHGESDDPLEKGVLAGILAGFVTMLAAGLHCDSFYLIRPMEAMMLLSGLAIARAKPCRPASVRPRFHPRARRRP